MEQQLFGTCFSLDELLITALNSGRSFFKLGRKTR